MSLTDKQIREALKQPQPSDYLRRNYKISSSEARALMDVYKERRTKSRVKNTKLSLIAASALAIAGTLSYLAIPQQPISLPRPAHYVRKTPAISSAETQKRIEEEISSFCDIQEVLNPGQPKTLYIFSAKHQRTEKDAAGRISYQTISPEVPEIQAQILLSLVSIDKHRTIEGIVAETVEWEQSIPYIDSLNKRVSDYSGALKFFSENPLCFADTTFAQMRRGIKLAGIRESKYQYQFDTLRANTLKRMALFPQYQSIWPIIQNDPVSLELYKQYCKKQDERSLDFLNRSLNLLNSLDAVALVLGANHTPEIYDALIKNPREGVTCSFLSPWALKQTLSLENHKLHPDYFSVASFLIKEHEKKESQQ